MSKMEDVEEEIPMTAQYLKQESETNFKSEFM